MLIFNNIRQFLAVISILLILPGGLLDARTKKGDKWLKLARQAELGKEYEKALELYTQAYSTDPADSAYEMGVRRVRFQVGILHVESGQKLRQAGKLEEALMEFQKGFNVDPSSAIAMQEMRRTSEAIEQRRNGNPAEKPMTAVEHAQQVTQEKIESMLPVPELKPITSQISTLKMNNQPPKVLYETVGKLAGVNVIFDPQYQPATRNINLDLTNSSLEEALNYIGLLTKTFWKPVSANAIFVTDDNVTKRRDYEDEVVKVFYLKNVTSVQEFQEVVTAVRSVTDIRRMFTYNAQNAVMARGTVDQINLAEKLFHDLDKAKSEVVMDVVVLEVNSDRTRNIAAGLVSGGQTGLVIPVGFTPRSSLNGGGTSSTTTTGTGTGTGTTGTTGTTTTTTTGGSGTSASISASQIGKVTLSDFSLTLPGALLQAVMSDNSTKIMQSPELRASDGMKVSLKIGEKVPFASGSFQPGVGSVGVSPLVSTQFQFAETGVNVEFTPHIHGTDEISLHIVVDVSNVSRTVTIGGIDQPVIAQRKNEADIRIRDGEVSLLGGLINNQDTASYSGIPGFTNVPILGKFLLGSNNADKSSSNLLIALIPHIVRSPNVEALDLRGVAVGSDQIVKLNYAPRKEEPAPAPPPAAASPAAASPAAASPAASAPAVPSAASPAVAALSIFPANPQVAISAPLNLMLMAQNVSDLTTAPIRLKWDPKVLRLNEVKPGNLFTQGGAVSGPTVDIRNDAGEATVGISRTGAGPALNGTGPILELNFVSVAKGTTRVEVTEANLLNSKTEPIRVAPVSVMVVVQ